MKKRGEKWAIKEAKKSRMTDSKGSEKTASIYAKISLEIGYGIGQKSSKIRGKNKSKNR